MKPIPEALTEFTFVWPTGDPQTNKSIFTGTLARRHLNAALQKASEQLLMPIPAMKRKLRRRMLETLADHRPVWDRSDQHGNPGNGATIVLPKEQKIRIAAVIDKDGTILPSEGTTPQQVEEIKRLLRENGQDVQDPRTT